MRKIPTPVTEAKMADSITKPSTGGEMTGGEMTGGEILAGD